MAMYVDTGAILEWTIQMSLYGQLCLTTQHYILTTSSGSIDGKLAVQDFDKIVNSGNSGCNVQDLADCCSLDLLFTGMTYQWISPLRYARITLPSMTTNGSSAAPCQNPAAAVCITRRSSIAAGRHCRGVLHLPGVPFTAMNQGLVTPTATGAYNVFAQDCISVIKNADSSVVLTPCVYNRKYPGTSLIADDWSVSPQIRTMKRRVVGRGI